MGKVHEFLAAESAAISSESQMLLLHELGIEVCGPAFQMLEEQRVLEQLQELGISFEEEKQSDPGKMREVA